MCRKGTGFPGAEKLLLANGNTVMTNGSTKQTAPQLVIEFEGK